MWEVEYTDEFEGWWHTLTEYEQEHIVAAVSKLEERGPTLGRPLADTLKGSKYPNMKELRPLGGSIRILFAFAPHRKAILLLGGDKVGKWKGWYEKAVPEAERLYEVYLEEIEEG